MINIQIFKPSNQQYLQGIANFIDWSGGLYARKVIALSLGPNVTKKKILLQVSQIIDAHPLRNP
jgi:hypothetical protein